MRLSAGDLARYRDATRQVARDAASAVARALESGGARGATELRSAAIEAITQSVGVHGDMAQAVAGQLFDEVVDAEGLGAGTFELYDDIIDLGMLEEKVRYYARKVVMGNVGGFVDDASALAEWYAWRCGRTAMVRNCEANGVRYARVPTSANPCDWCVMLASRGFVFHSADLAEAGGHEHCECVVVPGGPRTTVEGYDPDEYLRMWDDSGFRPPARRGTRDRAKSGGTRRRAGEGGVLASEM